jgi:hypothetical protein
MLRPWAGSPQQVPSRLNSLRGSLAAARNRLRPARPRRHLRKNLSAPHQERVPRIRMSGRAAYISERSRLRHAGMQQVVKVHDADWLLRLDDDQRRLLQRIEHLQRFAGQLVRPHDGGRCSHDPING